jgi:catechol 2,3-dioxygenase-like lactoylglutathione lyase family enzyme
MIPRIDHIAVAVESIEESRRLYEDLGLEIE